MTLPILICSKGRPDGPTFKTLDAAGLDYHIITEKRDAVYYSEFHDPYRLIELPKSGEGLAYSRQFALTYARAKRWSWYWMLDDDIKGFFQTTPEKKTVPIPAYVALNRAEEILESVDFMSGTLGMAGLEYQQFAWSNTRPVVWNSYCDVAVCIRSDIPVNYRTQLPFKGDRDFTLQILSLGFNVAKLAQLSFAVPRNGSNKGGLYDLYKTDKEKWASEEMERLWGPAICKATVKKDGRPDVKINWRAFQTK
jgi:hypothetical protein